jgi:hypothetical protein
LLSEAQQPLLHLSLAPAALQQWPDWQSEFFVQEHPGPTCEAPAIAVGAAMLVLAASTAEAGRVPQANIDGGYSCDQSGASIVVWVTREYRWPGRVKIWDGQPFVDGNLRRVVTYRDLRDSPEGGVLVGELSDGLHRLRSTYHQHVLDRLRIRINCVP